jgi:hypothetical protein
MQHFYDGQIRRYITQIVRMLSNFSHKDIEGNLKTIPVVYGDLARQVGSILKDNSELKIIGAPKISVYITGLELDRSRLSDSSFVSKVNIRERAYDSNNEEYLNMQGKNYTVERLMPTPYNLSINADIWSTNTDQKLQILEQILMLFNPSLEIQTTDNFVDWTSLSVVNLENITFSSRSIGTSTESEIDIATLGFSTPIYISPPAKVKKLGIIHTIITSIFNESYGNVDLHQTMPELLAYADSRYKSDAIHKTGINEDGTTVDEFGNLVATRPDTDAVIATTYKDYDLFVMNDTLKLIPNTASAKSVTWKEYLDAYPDIFNPGISEIHLYRNDLDTDIVGSITISSLDDFIMSVNWDYDTLPSDTIISGPTGDKTKIDYIIDPIKTNPTNLKTVGLRLLLLDTNIGNTNNTDGADAWKNDNGTDFIAGANDIIEWNGNTWHVVFDSSEHGNEIVYTTNLNTNIQYKFINNEWILSFEGEYPHGSWRINF